MPRRKPDDAVKQRMWAAVLKAANRHHNYPTKGIQTRIANDAGVSKAAVSDWKNLGNYPEEETLRRLADLYGVSAEILSGYIEGDVLATNYGPPDEMLRRSTEITNQVLKRLLPDFTLEQFMAVSQRVNQLILEGRSDAEVRGYLFDEIDDCSGQSDD